MPLDILEQAGWLEAEAVTHIAMEATGVYWKPIYNPMEGRFTVLLVNERHVKHVPVARRRASYK
jgi:transposase